MLGVVIEALITANQWIFQSHTNSDVENDIGELLIDMASRGRDIFSLGGAERRIGGERKSQTHMLLKVRFVSLLFCYHGHRYNLCYSLFSLQFIFKFI